MALVTFLSDFGTEDHYVAVVKATILKEDPEIKIVDISHQINPFDIGHAAYVLSHAYPNFPEGTIHLVAVDPSDRNENKPVALQLNGHYFVGCDNGIFSLISENQPDVIVQVPTIQSTFIARDLLASLCVKIAKGIPLEKLGQTIDHGKKLFNRLPKITKREIVGNVIRVDKYGNLITNILKKDFDKIREINGNVNFQVQVGRERYGRFHSQYDEADPGDCYLLFNSDGKLQIGINKGNASELLGLRMDAPIFIEFNI